MPFTTLSYIVLFAVVFFAYYAIPRKGQWWLLLLASYVFYSYVSAYCLIFLAVTTLVTYAGAVLMDNSLRKQADWVKEFGKSVSREEKKAYKERAATRRRWVLIGVIVALLSLLGVFKYLEFVLQNVSAVAGLIGFPCNSPALNIILPIGLSFYIFQSLGYCIDVQREIVPAERNVFKHALYVSFFPQLLQGPIGDYGRLAPQLFAGHAFDYAQVKFGIQRVAWGFFKKLVIANGLAHNLDPVWTNVGACSGLGSWSVILFCYAIQLYADFSGYMDIACGCAQMLGVKLDENFNCPYFAKDVADFWRRWHMTLGEWFKNYLFYPLLRSDWNTKLRKSLKGKYAASTFPTVAALAIVWLLIGLWHGASWNYIVYGLYYGVFMVLAVLLDPFYQGLKARFPKVFDSKAYSLFQMVRTFLIVVAGYSLFKPADLASTMKIVSSCTDMTVNGLASLRLFVRAMGPLWLAVGVMFAVDVVHYQTEKGTIRRWMSERSFILQLAVCVLGLLYILNFGTYGDGYNHFEYFKF